MNRALHPSSTPPPLHSIHRGIVTRLTPYGCFVKLWHPSHRSRHHSHSGLVHISQLHATKIDDVHNVVDVDMPVYVKIIEVERVVVDANNHDDDDDHDDDGRLRRPPPPRDARPATRHRIRLSMKYVDQENGTDYDPDNAQLEQDLFRSRRKGGGAVANDANRGVDSVLGRALSSHIGMSCALDPGNLILRGKTAGAAAAGDGEGAQVTYNGYSLVGDEEEDVAHGEKDMSPPKNDDWRETNVLRPIGRGKGTTLPAWMTRREAADTLGNFDRSVPVHNEQDGSDEDSSHNKRGRKRGEQKDKRRDKHNKRHKKHDRQKDRSRRRERSPSPSYSSSSSSFRSDSRSPSRERKRSHRKRNDRSRRRHKIRHTEYRRSRSRERDFESGPEFANVEEARAVMERLERRRREK